MSSNTTSSRNADEIFGKEVDGARTEDLFWGEEKFVK